jgi:hypothetical protein
MKNVSAILLALLAAVASVHGFTGYTPVFVTPKRQVRIANVASGPFLFFCCVIRGVLKYDASSRV